VDADVIAWAFGGYIICFSTGFSLGLLHKYIIKLTESLS